MSAVELAMEKVKSLDEEGARALLAWFEFRTVQEHPKGHPSSARSVIGFARRFRKEPRSTASWLHELRTGDE